MNSILSVYECSTFDFNYFHSEVVGMLLHPPRLSMSEA